MKTDQTVPLCRRSKAKRRDPLSLILFLLVVTAASITLLLTLFFIGTVLIKGIPNLTPSLFEKTYNAENVSLIPALVNTAFMVVIAMLMAAPVGVFSAVYLSEYAKKDRRITRIIRLTADTLSGIPSIVYGLFGMLFFVVALGWGMSLIAGACTLAIMILPLIMRTSEDALRSVPVSDREAAFSLGAGKLRTICKVVLPSAAPGILSGVLAGIGKIVGESAALIYTAGVVAEIAKGKDFLFDSTRTLAVQLFVLAGEGIYENQAYGTAVMLLAIVALINLLSGAVAKRAQRNDNEQRKEQ